MSKQDKAICYFKKSMIPVFLILGICGVFAIPPLLSASSGSFYTKCKYVAYAMSKGYLPYKDIYDHTGILYFFINYIGIKIEYNFGLILIGTAFMAVGVIFSYKMIRLFMNDGITVLAVITGFVSNVGLYTGEDYTIMLTAIGLFYGVSILKGRNMKKTDWFLCGVCFACTLFLSATLAILWIVVSLGLGAAWMLCQKKIYISWKSGVMSLLGIMIVVVPVCGYLLGNDLLELWLEMDVLYSFESLQLFSGSGIVSGMNTPCTYIMAAVLLYLVYLFLTTHETDYGCIVGLCLCILGITMLIGIRNEWPFTSVGLIPVNCFFHGKVFQYFMDKSKNRWASGGTYMMAAVIAALNVWTAADALYAAAGEHGIWKTNEADAELVSDIRDLVQTVDEIGERYSVFGDWNYVYIKTRKISDSKYFYLFPLVEREPEILDQYLEEILEKETFLIIIDDQDTYQTPFYKELRQFFRQWLEEHKYYTLDSEKKYYFKYYED